jgi:hypothetical protein
MPLTDSEGTQYQDMADYKIQSVQQQQQSRTQGYQKSVSDTLDTYHVSPAFKQGIYYNINAESGWNPYNRHEDQPKFGGEAHYSHGLFQEGGSDTQPLMDYAIGKGKQWTDPSVQTQYVFEGNPKGQEFLKKYGQSQDWREVAAGFAKDYLKPREDYLQDRIRNIYGEKGPPRITVTPSNYPDFNNAHIDREHDVPLLAGGLMDNGGNVYGTALDRRIPHYMNLDDESGKGPITIDSAQFVHQHEMDEIQDMEKLIHGQSYGSAQAYTQSHNQVATPREQAAVQKYATAQGRDPDKIWANYQKFWKEQLGSIEKSEPVKVHPDMYLHPYDGHKYQTAMEEGAKRSIEEHPKSKEMDELGKGLSKDKNPFGGLLDLMNEEEGKPFSALEHGKTAAKDEEPSVGHLEAMAKADPHNAGYWKRKAFEVADAKAEQIASGFGTDAGGTGIGGIMAGKRAFSVGRELAAAGMETLGASPERTFKQTGLFRGAEGKWRKELSDIESGFFKDEDMTIQPHYYDGMRSHYLGDVFKHDELFKYYPELENIRLVMETGAGDQNWVASNWPGESRIHLNMDFLSRLSEKAGWSGEQVGNYLHSVMLHELQHAVQDIEKFAKGGSFAQESEKGAAKYHRLSGEVEARNVQRRFTSAINEKMGQHVMEATGTPKGWRSIEADTTSHKQFPRSTEDVPPDKQITRYLSSRFE